MARPKTVNPGLIWKDLTVNPGNVTAATALDVTATVTGLRVGYPVLLWAPSLEDNVSLSNAHCSAANTLKFRLGNLTAADINPASQTMYVVQM